MKTETLGQALAKLDAATPCLLTVHQTLTVGDLLGQAHDLCVTTAMPPGCRVALVGLAPAELIKAIVAFDGIADALLLLPAALEAEARAALINAAACTHRLNNGANELVAVTTVDTPLPVGKPTQWLLATSGTTGAPKLIGHSLATLSRTVRRDSLRGGEFIWGLLYDPCRFAGMQVVLQSLISGSRLALPDAIEFERQIQVLLQHDVTALSATPSLWRKLLMDGRIASLKLRQLTLGGETADQTILDALQRRFPSSRIVHIYASTEAGTGFAVQDGRAGFPSNWLDNLANVPALRISNDNHLLIKPPLLANGEAIASRLDTDGFLDTQDLVRMEGDRVYFLGRSTGAINVGGNKVNPEEVEACLRRVGGVLDARVFAKTSSMMGQLVAAEIIAVSGQEPKLLRQQIQQFCRAELEPWQIPALLSFVDALKETAAGKRERVSQ